MPAIMPQNSFPNVVSTAPGADMSSANYDYHNLPPGLNWRQYLAPLTHDPVYYAQQGNTSYYVGPNNQLYEGSPSDFFFSNATNDPSKYLSTSTDQANYVNPLASAAKIPWSTLESVTGTPSQNSIAPSASGNDAQSQLLSAFSSLVQNMPQPAAPASLDPTQASPTVVPVTSGGGANVGVILAVLVIAVAVWYWYRKHHGGGGE